MALKHVLLTDPHDEGLASSPSRLPVLAASFSSQQECLDVAVFLEMQGVECLALTYIDPFEEG